NALPPTASSPREGDILDRKMTLLCGKGVASASKATVRRQKATGLAAKVTEYALSGACMCHRCQPRARRRGATVRSVAIVVGLERAFHRHADVVGLTLAQLRQMHAQLVKVKRGNLLVQVLGQHVNVVLVL